MTEQQADKIIKELESLNWKVWEIYNIAKGTPTNNVPPINAPGGQPTVAAKNLYDQFVKNKK